MEFRRVLFRSPPVAPASAPLRALKDKDIREKASVRSQRANIRDMRVREVNLQGVDASRRDRRKGGNRGGRGRRARRECARRECAAGNLEDRLLVPASSAIDG